jgi:hypothetical protein
MPITVAGSCSRSSTCTWPLPPSLVGEPALAWSITVREAGGLPGPAPRSATTGLRITDLQPTGGVTRVDVPAEAGGDLIQQAASNTTVDVMYYPGTGFEIDGTIAGPLFQDALRRQVDEMRGFGRNVAIDRYASSAHDNWQNVAIWAGPTVIDVSPDVNAECWWAATGAPSFAETVGVLHRVPCRDNAPHHEFSTSTVRTDPVGWHELHHSLYDELDEYCCDGGYRGGVFLGNGLNVYGDEGSCRANTEADPDDCREIAETVDGVTTRTGAWKADPDARDVMSTNHVEHPDDLKAARLLFERCRKGSC